MACGVCENAIAVMEKGGQLCSAGFQILGHEMALGCHLERGHKNKRHVGCTEHAHPAISWDDGDRYAKFLKPVRVNGKQVRTAYEVIEAKSQEGEIDG